MEDKIALSDIIKIGFTYNIINKVSFTLIMLFVTIFLSIVMLSLQHVYAHPIPILFNPKPNEIVHIQSILQNEITIAFSERIELKASNIHVIDSNHDRVDKNDLKLKSDKILSVSLDKSKLKTGVFTVYWLVLSKDDGFITKGSYIFSIIQDRPF